MQNLPESLNVNIDGKEVRIDPISPRSFADIDAMADFSERISQVETRNVQLSRRITALEDHTRGSFEDDPTKLITSMVVGMLVLQVVLPMICDMVAKWRLQSSSS